MAFGLALASVVPTPSAWSLPKANRRLLRSEPSPFDIFPVPSEESVPSASVSNATFEAQDNVSQADNTTTTEASIFKAPTPFGRHDRDPLNPTRIQKMRAQAASSKAHDAFSKKIHNDTTELPQSHDDASSDNKAQVASLMIGAVLMVISAAMLAFFLYERSPSSSPADAQQEPSQSLVEGAAPPVGDEETAADAAEIMAAAGGEPASGDKGAAAAVSDVTGEAGAAPTTEPAAAAAADEQAAPAS